MILAHNLLVVFRRILNKLMKIMKKTIYFENNYGIKAYAKPHFHATDEMGGKIVDVNPNEVHLSFDALKDSYTHLGMSLGESPHIGLIKAIREGKDITETTYYKEEIEGRLDGRYEQPYSQSLVERHVAASMTKKDGLPIVYLAGGVLYVLDGKHRLATALIDNLSLIKCLEIPASVVGEDKYAKSILKEMKKKPRDYSINIRHLETIVYGKS